MRRFSLFAALAIFLTLALAPLPAHASTGSLTCSISKISAANIRQQASINIELSSSDGGHKWRVNIFEVSKAFTSQSEMSDFEKDPSIANHLVVTKEGDTPLTLATPLRLQLEIPNAPTSTLEIRGYVLEVSSGQTTGTKVPFFLTGKGGSGVSKTPISWIWPILDTPHRDLAGSFINDELALTLTPQGRLGRLVSAGEGQNFLWYVDAELIESVEAMTQGYKLKDGSEGKGSAVATQWLTRFKSVIGGQSVVAAPFGDPDLVTAVKFMSPENLQKLSQLGASRLSKSLGRDIRSDLAWPSLGIADAKTLSFIAKAGYRKIIVSRSASPLLVNETATRSGLGSNNGVTYLFSDNLTGKYLSKISVESSNRLYAHLAMVTAERPGISRPQILIPDRMPSLTYSQALALQPQIPVNVVPLSALINLKVNEVMLAPIKSPPLERRVTDVLPKIVFLIEQFQGVTDPTSTVSQEPKFRSTLVISSAWRSQTFLGYLYSQGALRSAQTFNAQGRVLPGRYTLTSLSAKLPITLANDSSVPLRLWLSLRPTTLRLNQPSIIEVTLLPKGRSQVLVPVKANSSGDLSIEASLIDANGKRVGEIATLSVQITSIPRAALWITEAAGVGLLLAAGAQVFRRIRSSRRADQVAKTDE